MPKCPNRVTGCRAKSIACPTGSLQYLPLPHIQAVPRAFVRPMTRCLIPNCPPPTQCRGPPRRDRISHAGDRPRARRRRCAGRADQRDSRIGVLHASMRRENFVADARNEMKIPLHALTAESLNFVHGSLLLPPQPAAYSLQMSRGELSLAWGAQSRKLRG